MLSNQKLKAIADTVLSANKSDTIKLLGYILGMVFYTGFFIRSIRTIAYLSEVIFYHSYKVD